VNLPVFIANRLSGKDKEKLSGPVIRIAVLTIALGIAVMIIAVSVLIGFQTEIRNKVIGFSAHIKIDNFDANESYETFPVSTDQSFYPELEEVEGIRHIQIFGLKAGIIKTADQLHGVLLKGISDDFDWNFFEKYLVSGSTFQEFDSMTSSELLISDAISSKLKLNVGDEVRMYFLSGSEAQPRGRKFAVSGIFETGLEEFDEVYVIGDIRNIQSLNNWSDDMASGFEVFIDDFKSLDEMEQIVNELKFQTSDMVDEERAVQLGKLLGVDHFVTFSVRSVHGIYQVTAKLISLETGKVVRIVVERCEDTKFEFLTALCNEIAYNLAGIEERKGSVRIESTPAEAEVFLFGISRGFSPIVLPLAPGPYLITVKKSGYKWKRKTLRIAPKQESLWEVQLNRKRERKLRDYINGEGVWK